MDVPTDAPEPDDEADTGPPDIGPDARPALPLEVISGRVQTFAHLVWMQERFALVWITNDSGRLYVELATLDPATLALTPPVHVSANPPTGGTPDTTEAVWDGRALHIFWSNDTGIHRRQYTEQAAPLGPEERVVAVEGANINLKGAMTTSRGTGLVWLDDSGGEYHYQPKFAALDDGAALPAAAVTQLAETTTTVWMGGVSDGFPHPCNCNDRLAYWMSWVPSGPNGSKSPLAATLFDDHGEVLETLFLYEGDTVHQAWTGPTMVAVDGEPLAGAWEVREGAFVAGRQGAVFLDIGDQRPVMTRGLDGSIGVLVTGDAEDTRPVTSFQLLAPNLRPVADPLLLEDTLGRSLDAHTIAASPRGYGALLEISSRVYFYEFIAP